MKSHPIVYLTEGLASGRFKSDQIENDVKVKCVFGQNHWKSFFSQIRKKLLLAVAGSGEDVNLMNNLRQSSNSAPHCEFGCVRLKMAQFRLDFLGFSRGKVKIVGGSKIVQLTVGVAGQASALEDEFSKLNSIVSFLQWTRSLDHGKVHIRVTEGGNLMRGKFIGVLLTIGVMNYSGWSKNGLRP